MVPTACASNYQTVICFSSYRYFVVLFSLHGVAFIDKSYIFFVNIISYWIHQINFLFILYVSIIWSLDVNIKFIAYSLK